MRSITKLWGAKTAIFTSTVPQSVRLVDTALYNLYTVLMAYTNTVLSGFVLTTRFNQSLAVHIINW